MHLTCGVFGLGVVGGGVVDLVTSYTKNGRAKAVGASIFIKKVCVRDVKKAKQTLIDTGNGDNSSISIVTEYDDILKDDSINCVMELMGGVTNAKDIVFAAIAAGKHVITANKALLANFLSEILLLLSKNPSVKLCFEAAVCGGIPVIHSLCSDYYADSINKVMGIMNGTTNFMLSKMETEGASYAEALSEAQSLGFAEADPTADVEGLDVQAKLSLLAKLCYGRNIDLSTVPTKGISSLTSTDFENMRSMNCTVKLVGCASAFASSSLQEPGSVQIYVSPHAVPLSSPLASVSGAGNIVVISSKNMGESTMTGPGAGRYPTANSVLSDLFRLSCGLATPAFPLDEPLLAVTNDYSGAFYVRVTCVEECDGNGGEGGEGGVGGVGGEGVVGIAQKHISTELRTVAAAAGVTCSSISCNESQANSLYMKTGVTCESNMQAFSKGLSKCKWIAGPPFYMPILPASSA